MNARPRKQTMNEIARKRILHLNSADVHLYKHFWNKFQDQASNYNEKLLHLEVKYLHKRRRHWYRKCVEKELSSEKERQFNVVQFKSKPTKDVVCKLMTTTELELTEYIRERQKRLYPGSVYTKSPITVKPKNNVKLLPKSYIVFDRKEWKKAYFSIETWVKWEWLYKEFTAQCEVHIFTKSQKKFSLWKNVIYLHECLINFAYSFLVQFLKRTACFANWPKKSERLLPFELCLFLDWGKYLNRN